jgi:hypothetical protein
MESTESMLVARQKDVSSSGVSWGGVIAGAVVAAALALIMLALGAGFGLSVVSPWSNAGAAASTVGTLAIIWFIVTQIVASAFGGYLAGRLRTRWPSIHNDEAHFRDTANGLTAWAVGVVLTVSFLATAAATMAGASASAGAESRDAARQNPNAYFVDRLFRTDRPAPDKDLSLQAEAGRILAHSTRDMPAADSSYLAQMVVARTGLRPADADKRVAQTIADATQAEDELRKSTAHILLWIFIALLTGAFCASYAATIGGRQRDHVQMI